MLMLNAIFVREQFDAGKKHAGLLEACARRTVDPETGEVEPVDLRDGIYAICDRSNFVLALFAAIAFGRVLSGLVMSEIQSCVFC